jgi:streptogramin lyase
MRARLLSLVAVLAWLAAPAPAGAAATSTLPIDSSGSGIAVGPDGNLWVAQPFSMSVLRMTPGGTVLGRYTVGNNPTTVAVGPGGTVWVAVTGAKALVRFDATAAVPTATTIPLGTSCGPVALVDGGDGNMYFSLPSDGTCNGGVGTISSIRATAIPPTITTPSDKGGQAFDLAVSAGHLFVPSFDEGVVRRFALGNLSQANATYTLPGGSSPNGIAVDGVGHLWVTDYAANRVFRFQDSDPSGSASTLTPTGGTVGEAFGIVASTDGFIYVAGASTKNLLRISSDGTQFAFFPLDLGQPVGVADGPAGDLFLTDRSRSQVVRFVNGPPRPGATVGSASGATTIAASAPVDPHGNETSVVFEYGPTTAYGQTSAPVTIPVGVDPVSVSASLAGLTSGSTYHVRVRASSAEGAAVGADVAVALPAASAAPTPAPTISGARLSPKSFRVAKGKKGGSKLTVTLSAPGSVDATISAQTKGVKKTKSGKTTCVAPPKKKAKGAKACTRLVKKGTLHFGPLQAGQRTVAVTGKVGGKRLAPGKYTLTATLGASSTSTTFAIKR